MVFALLRGASFHATVAGVGWFTAAAVRSNT
jgi:hypothetical protein